MTSFIFKWIGFWKKIWISFGKISNSKLYATQWYSWGKIRWLLQLCEIGVGSYNESSWKSFESALKPSFKFWVLNLNFKLWHVGNISKKLCLINTWSKVWEEQTWHSKNIRGNSAKRFGFKSEIYLNLKKIYFYEVWILPLEKCSSEREFFRWSFGYIYTLYKIFIDLVLFLL